MQNFVALQAILAEIRCTSGACAAKNLSLFEIPYKKPLAEKSSPQMGLNHKRVRPKMMQILKVYRPFGSPILNECTI